MPRRRLALAVVLLLLAWAPAHASDAELSGAEGHPRARLPLALYAASTGEAGLDAVVDRAVADWNALARDALGLAAFARVSRGPEAAVVVAVGGVSPTGLMGLARVSSSAGVIELPVRVEVFAPAARGQTSRETLFYQVLAHELGHALGLPHAAEPASVMCCRPGSVDFNEPAARDAYVQARRHPDLRSVRAQLAEHYARFWREGAAAPGR